LRITQYATNSEKRFFDSSAQARTVLVRISGYLVCSYPLLPLRTVSMLPCVDNGLTRSSEYRVRLMFIATTSFRVTSPRSFAPARTYIRAAFRVLTSFAWTNVRFPKTVSLGAQVEKGGTTARLILERGRKRVSSFRERREFSLGRRKRRGKFAARVSRSR